MRPRAAVARLGADLRQGTAPHAPRPPRTAAWCPTVRAPVTLGSPGRGSHAGTDRPYPHLGAAIPGAALRARECERTEVALLRLQEGAALSPPTPRSRPHEGSLSWPLPLPKSLSLPLPQSHPTQEPARLGSRPRSRPPPAQGPRALGGSSVPGAWRGGRRAPSQPGAFPGAAVTRGRAPPRLPPSLPGPRLQAVASQLDPGSEGPPPTRLWPHPPRPQVPHPGNGAGGGLHSDNSRWISALCADRVTPGFPTTRPFPGLASARPPHPSSPAQAGTQQAPSARPLPWLLAAAPGCCLASGLRRWGHQGGRWVDSSSAPWARPRLSLSAPFSREPAVRCSSPDHS